MATYDLTSVSMPATLAMGDILNCPYSGDKVSIILPAGRYLLECWGAEGGYRSSQKYGGNGGYSKGVLTLEEATNIYLYAGGRGGNSNTNTNAVRAGGFNGGGYRYGFPGGGGASDIRIETDSLYARVIVAGGGGSDGADSRAGGAAGVSASSGYGNGGIMGNTTYSGSSVSTTATQQSKAGLSSSDITKTYGGFGFGGAGLYKGGGYGGAGGGGWYGGQGTLPDSSVDDDRGGGGGSGYVYTQQTADQIPAGYLLSGKYYLTQAETIIGTEAFLSPTNATETGHQSDGYVRITVGEVINDPTKRKSARIQQKGHTKDEWDPNAVLLSREIGIETDTNKIKIGDGITPWSELEYIATGSDSNYIYTATALSTSMISIEDPKLPIFNTIMHPDGYEKLDIPDGYTITVRLAGDMDVGGTIEEGLPLQISINGQMSANSQVLINDYYSPFYSDSISFSPSWWKVGKIITMRYIDQQNMWLADLPITQVDLSKASNILPTYNGGTGVYATSAANLIEQLDVLRTGHQNVQAGHGTDGTVGHVRGPVLQGWVRNGLGQTNSTFFKALWDRGNLNNTLASGSGFNEYGLHYDGELNVQFTLLTDGIPSTLAEDSGISDSSHIFKGKLIVAMEDFLEGDGNYGKHTLIIPQYGLQYERYIKNDVNNTSNQSIFGDWKKSEPLTKKELKQEIGMPVGSIIWHAAVTPPAGYLVCDGSAVSKTTYAELYSVIGTNWGEAPDNCFLLPDLRDEFIRGYNPDTAATRNFGSKQEGTKFTAGEYAAHYESNGEASGNVSRDYGGNYSTPGSDPVIEVRPRNMALLPCIKY